jgi:tetratricopeptide (TPR) repeat protein
MGALLVLVAGAAGCGARGISDFRKALETTWKLERQGQFDEAAASAQKAADLAGENPKDRDRALFLKARMLVKAGRLDEAMEIFLSLSESAFEESMRGRCIYEMGLIENSRGNRQAARKHFLTLIRKHPDHGLCSVALKKTMLIVEETAGKGAVRPLLLELLPGALKSSFGDDVLWELAKLEKKSGNLDEAEKYLLMIHKAYPYPKGGAAFEYLFLLSEIEEERKNYEKAVEWLQTIADTTEKSYLLGDYNDDAKAKALLRMGRIYHEKMGRHEDAYKTFMKVAKLNWAIRSDDGLWWAARVRFSQGRSHDACKLLAKLVKKYTYSNYLRKSLKLLQGSECAGGAEEIVDETAAP